MTNAMTLDALPDPVVRVDGDRRIVEANEAALRLAGRPSDGVVGQLLSDVFAPRGRDGTPLLVDAWHASSRLRSVTGIPEHEVTISSRRPARLSGEGWRVVSSPARAAADADVVCSIVPDNPEVTEVVESVLEGASAGTVVVEMSTISPVTA